MKQNVAIRSAHRKRVTWLNGTGTPGSSQVSAKGHHSFDVQLETNAGAEATQLTFQRLHTGRQDAAVSTLMFTYKKLP